MAAGDKPIDLDHLAVAAEEAFSVDEAAAVPGARPAGEGSWRLPPERNLGLRQRLARR